MGNLCFSSSNDSNEKPRKTRKLSINVLYNKQKVLKIKKLAIKKVCTNFCFIIHDLDTFRNYGQIKTL